MTIEQRLRARRTYFDGGMGTLLQKQGLLSGELPETWNLTHPQILEEIHLAYMEAGANVITSNTFLKLPYSNGQTQWTYVVTALDRLQNESKAVKKKVKL